MKNSLKNIEDHKLYIKKFGQDKYNKYINGELLKLKSSNSYYNTIDKNSKGIAFGLKDNYVNDNTNNTASTNILKKYKSPFSSDVSKLLCDKKYCNFVRTNMDELAMGGLGIFSNIGIVPNALNDNYISAGSSSGSAYLVSKQILPFSIGSDTGDSVIKPAAYNKVIGFKPTWGLVSRYGLMDFSPSFDHVAWFTNSVNDTAYIADILVNKTNNEQTNIESKETSYLKNIDNKINFKIVVLKNIDKILSDKKILDNYNNSIKNLVSQGYKIKEINFDVNLLESIPFIYSIITNAESLSSNSNLTGISFGKRNKGDDYKEIILNSRDFGKEARKRFLIGEFVMHGDNMENIFLNAKKLRNLFIKEFNRVMKLNDILLIPTITNKPEKISDVLKNKKNNFSYNDSLNQIANITGSPSLSLPNGDIGDNLSSSVTLISKPFEDQKILNLAKILERWDNE